MQNLGLENEAAFKATSGLSGGLGRTGRSACGALSAGVMAIGLAYGRDKQEKSGESSAYKETMRRAGLLCDKVEKEFGSTICRDIQLKIYGKTWNMRDPNVLEDMKATTQKEHKCADVTGKIAQFAAEVILDLE
ncbi:MAG: C_GCAxxG_C_C family protein [Chloroflexi bacterium]|nr:C_GCAxxG_C_C family protein [Chloroflexota bacterium]